MPADHRAGLADPGQALRLSCELGEQHDSLTRGDREITGAIQRGRHEFRPDYPIASVERGIWRPRRGHDALPGNLASVNTQTVSVGPMHATNKTRWKRMAHEPGVVTGRSDRFLMTWRPRWLQVNRRRTALANNCVTVTNLDTAVPRLDHRKRDVQRRRS